MQPPISNAGTPSSSKVAKTVEAGSGKATKRKGEEDTASKKRLAADAVRFLSQKPPSCIAKSEHPTPADQVAAVPRRGRRKAKAGEEDAEEEDEEAWPSKAKAKPKQRSRTAKPKVKAKAVAKAKAKAKVARLHFSAEQGEESVAADIRKAVDRGASTRSRAPMRRPAAGQAPQAARAEPEKQNVANICKTKLLKAGMPEDQAGLAAKKAGPTPTLNGPTRVF